MAEACLADRPDLRHPHEAQAAIDAAHQIGDAQYLQMCHGENVHKSAQRLGDAAFAWTAGRSG